MPIPALVAAAPAIIGAAKGVYDIFDGESDYDKAKKEMDSLQRPFYKIQDEYTQNRNVGASRASQGFSDAQRDYLTTENERGLGAGISALTQGGGGVNDLAKILDVYGRTAARTAADDAQLQTQNIARFFDVNKDLGGQKTIQWHMNEFQPWADQSEFLSQQMQIAKKRQDQGFNNILSGASGAIGAFQNQDLLKAITGMKPPGAASATPQPGFGETRYYGNKPASSYADFMADDYTPAPPVQRSREANYNEVPMQGFGNQMFNQQTKASTDLIYDIMKNIWE